MSDRPIIHRRSMLAALAAAPAVAAAAAREQQDPVASGTDRRDAIVTDLTDFRRSGDGADWGPALGRAFDLLSSTRTAHPAYPRWGVGTVQAGRGVLRITDPLYFSASQYGFGIVGAGRFATVFTKRIRTGHGFLLNPSGYSRFADFTLVNEADARGSGGTDAAFVIDGTNGGHMTTFERVVLTNFTYGVSITGTTNGDFTHLVDCELATRYGYTNNANKNAVSAIFDGSSFACADAVLRLGGSGEVSLRGGGANIHGSLVEYREGAGVNGIYPQSVAIDHMKLEYSGTAGTGGSARLLIDGRACRIAPDKGGADTVMLLRDITYALGDAPPGDPGGTAYDDHVIVDLAGGRHRIYALGGYVRGTIRYASDYLEDRARWLFARMRAAPRPSRLQLGGSGSHPLVEWSGNEGVADQYRGGQSGLRAIRTGTALLWRHSGTRLVNSAVDAVEFRQPRGGSRYGRNFTIDLAAVDLPPTVTIEALAVYIRDNEGGTDTRVEWFTDAGFSVLHDQATIPGARRGKISVSTRELTVTDGTLRVRITKPGPNDAGTIGALVIYYFPYVE